MEIIIIIISLVLDSFVASIGYSAEKIKIPNISVITINIVSCLILTLSLFLGNYIKEFLPAEVATSLSFVIFLTLGIYKLFEGISKKYLSKFSTYNKPLTFKLFDFKFALQVYIDEKKADFDNSKKISLKESIYLALALSLDSFTVGLGISFLQINNLFFITLCFLFGISSFKLGSFIGNKYVSKSDLNISPFAGLLLLLIAFTKL